MPGVIVYPPHEDGGRSVRIDGAAVGRAMNINDVVEFLRHAGLEGVDSEDVNRADWITWRGGGPDVWSH